MSSSKVERGTLLWVPWCDSEGVGCAGLGYETQDGQVDEIIASYVNGRIDIARKAGGLGKIDHGKLSATAARSVANDAWALMKGKRKLARLRNVCRESFGFDYKIDQDAEIPKDEGLAEIAQKNFKKK